MTNPSLKNILASTLGIAFAATSLTAGDPKDSITIESADSKTTLTLGLGYLHAQANEYVNGGPGGLKNNNLSQLNWDVDALTYNIGIEHELNDRWSLFADGIVSFGPDESNMVDYDWLEPGNSDWTHRSTHADTRLNHYVQIDAGIDYKLIDSADFSLKIRGGFRYTDISFDAYGGSYVYTSDPGYNFRDESGNWPADELGISYRQKLPGIYLGPQAEWNINDRLSVTAGGTAGITIEPSDRDHHWQRNTLFVGDFSSRGFYGANLGLDYKLKENSSLYIQGTYQKYVTTQGTSTISDPSGTEVIGGNVGGADFEATQVQAGIRIKF